MVKIKKLLKIIGINIIILIVLLKFLDLFLQDDKRPPKKAEIRKIYLKEYPPNAAITFMPDDNYMANSEFLTQKPYRVRTDSNGYIIGPNNILNKSNSVDIIFFGGSTTECKYVDEEKRFPYLVGEILSQKIGKRICARNAGVSGKNIMHSTLDLISKGIPLHPKIIVLMHNANDLSQLTKAGSYWKGPKTRTFLWVQPKVDENFYIFRSLKNIICPNVYSRLKNTYFFRLFLRPTTIPIDEWEDYRHRKEINYYDIENQYTNAILSFIYLAKVYNIEVVLMTQFSRINLKDSIIVNRFNSKERAVDFNTYFNFYTRFNEKTRDISKREGILLIDLADSIPSNNKYIYDAVHLNNAGSILAAEIIAEKIESEFYRLNN